MFEGRQEYRPGESGSRSLRKRAASPSSEKKPRSAPNLRGALTVARCDWRERGALPRLERLADERKELLGEVVGRVQIAAEEAHLAFEFFFQLHLAVAIGELGFDLDGGRAGHGGHLALFFAA